ncbi:UDP-N-acetylglucosamine 2-epimerase [Clostridium fungisolvens]|uniref:GDP/UDP-N,N'-diacetylbacillosamine 2-epimerase (Hydrolyzing) n=1 Tax=Clostridium fungisolvens TaxID=1604897 RepID=A0A6V8SQE4_9CLOT|nr:UDP-N-acetylglucosamine 2-epimerase [Clostridium fungisolvens]GFP77103.1 GDP/UDP-N,N'-diacetylbacillosamine 2-epimerase (hydrolyzing) [Clostridium fungisolvens]
MKKNICIITGSRAEYGLLKPIIALVDEDKELELRLVVTGMHLSYEFGLTYKEIEKDGFIIDEKIESVVSSDTSSGVSKSMGLTMIGFADYFARKKTDLVIVLGDRYEILAATCSALIANIPVAHIHGGETTEGSLDEAFRHSITKMSYLHFVSNEEYRKRVIQLGEDPIRVFNVGALGVENIMKMNLLNKSELEESIGFKLNKRYALVTFHPATLEKNKLELQLKEMLTALDSFKDIKIIFTKSNSDKDGRIINSLIDNYVEYNKERAIAFNSMGQLRYLSAMKYSSFVLGNSSSGIIEAPSFKIPTVNIGDRQKGRIQADSIINCDPNSKEITDAINKALNQSEEKLKLIINPYGQGNTSEKIVNRIKEINLDKISLKKSFYDL